MSESNHDIILEAYHKYFYIGANAIFKILKKTNKDITLKEVQDVIKSQTVSQLHNKDKKEN
jgi:hypothetical protein